MRGREPRPQIIEDRKGTQRNHGVGYYRPWTFILTDGISADADQLSATVSRVRRMEDAGGVTTSRS